MDRVQCLQHKYGRLPSTRGIQEVYSNTHSGSKRLEYCALTGVYNAISRSKNGQGFDEDLANSADSINDFAVDYVKLHAKHAARFASESKIQDPRVRSGSEKDGFGRCFFHTHAKGEVCHLEGSASKAE